jgi:hypothetical protein
MLSGFPASNLLTDILSLNCRVGLFLLHGYMNDVYYYFVVAPTEVIASN